MRICEHEGKGAYVVLDDVQRFLHVPHVGAKNGYLHGDFVLSGVYGSKLLSHLAKLIQDAGELLTDEAHVYVFVSHVSDLLSENAASLVRFDVAMHLGAFSKE